MKKAGDQLNKIKTGVQTLADPEGFEAVDHVVVPHIMDTAPYQKIVDPAKCFLLTEAKKNRQPCAMRTSSTMGSNIHPRC
ncbi:MAG: hypothetical protein Q7U84_07700 [Polynucleobacter sp.]|nr:hypothetical protein [Polynucleobacter sp.]